MEDINKTFYYLKHSMFGTKIMSITGDNVKWRETQGYTYDGKRVYVSIFSMIKHKKRVLDKNKKYDLFHETVVVQSMKGVINVVEELVTFAKAFFMFFIKLVALPFLPLFTIYEYIVYKKHISLMDKFQDTNEDDTEYLIEKDIKIYKK